MSDLPSVELSPAAARAVEVALAAGASAAEAYASRDTGREVRVHGGEVESLTAATQTGIGIRAWDGHRVGYAYGTDLSEAGVTALAARAAEMAAVADEDEFAAPPAPQEIEALPGLDSPSVGEWTAGQVADLALTVERTALAADDRIAGVETAVYADSTEQVAIASSTGIAASYESANCFAYLQALAEGDGGRETGLGFGLARGPEDLDPEAIGREGAERAVAMIGAGKPGSRSCPVVLDPTVAASFAGLIGGALGARAVQRGRSPFAGRLGDEVASTTFALHDDGRDPAGAASAPFDGEGVPHRRTALIEGGKLQRLPLRHLHRQPRGDRLDRLGGAGGLPLAALGVGLEPDRRHRLAHDGAAARRGGGRDLRHRRRRPPLGRQPGHRRLLRRRVRAGDPRRRAGRAGPRVHDRGRARRDAARGFRGRVRGALGPLRRVGLDPSAAGRRARDQRNLTAATGGRLIDCSGPLLAPCVVSRRPALLDCHSTSTPEEESRRDQG